MFISTIQVKYVKPAHQFYCTTNIHFIYQSRMQQSEDSAITHLSTQSAKISQLSEGVAQPSSTQSSQQHQISEEEKQRCQQIIKAFMKFIQDIEQSGVYRFTVVNPNRFILQELIYKWMLRHRQQQRGTKFVITLELKNVNLGQNQEKIIEKLFMHIGSIKLIVNQKVVQLNAIFREHGSYIYEGLQENMSICSALHKSEYIGQVIKISEEEYRYHGMGMLTFGNRKDGFEYIGEFEHGKRHGKGQMKMKMSFYEGDFKNDFMDGKGIEKIFKIKKKNLQKPIYIIQYTYQGNFKEGYRHGYGQQIKYDAHKYCGNWQRGQICGQGKIEFKNQDSYDGEWENNVYHGKGIYIEYNNCVYEGEFKDGRYHGKGVMTYDNGDRYEGEFEDGKKHGQGKYDWKEKNDQLDYYDGTWKNDSAEGFGSSMIRGQFYTGEFKNGKRHGEGQLNTQEGDYIRAIFDQGEIVRYLQKNGQIVDQ